MKLTIAMVAIPLVVSGCAPASPPDVSASNSPVSISEVAPLRHQNPLGDYNHRLAVEPKPWRELNDAQAPGGRS